MKDVSTWMIELVDTVAFDNLYFSVIRRLFDGVYYTLKFGVLQEDYNMLRYIITYRPFENTGVGNYRYFFTLGYQKNGQSEDVSIITVRIEQLKQNKHFQFPIGNKYLSNLLWFSEIKDRAILEPFVLA
jgi:hypothetical protein